MKTLVMVCALFATSTAMANSFDFFVGNYSVVEAPSIRKSGDVKECVRFGFENLVGFSVMTDISSPNQSHMLHFIVKGGGFNGWFGHPVMDFNSPNEFGTGGTYAKTSGGQGLARNDYVSWGDRTSRPLIVSIEKDGDRVILNVLDSIVEGSQVQAECAYQAVLQAK